MGGDKKPGFSNQPVSGGGDKKPGNKKPGFWWGGIRNPVSQINRVSRLLDKETGFLCLLNHKINLR
ncbi:hypothetical protein NIES39_A05870 [Arthrospira platensis NIES-39]|nr:hypothetical protein NIES39_A05870 [Arthrospira platensis NIES-39]